MINCKNVAAGQARSYYRADDYYREGAPPSAWCGKGAEALGLQELADADAAFAELLEGKLPNGQEIAAGAGGKRRAGTDLTISAPKSVSIAALVSGDARVVEAHNDAVRAALQRVEALIQARVTEKGCVRTEATGNMVARTVMHDTSRLGDPNLHTHCVILNVTQRADGRWAAIENRQIFSAQRELDMIYKSELAVRLASLGYQLRASRNGFELASVTDVQIEAFSRRRQDIDEALKERGTNREHASAVEREMAALATRDKKQDYYREQLRQEWLQRGEDLELNTSIPAAPLPGLAKPEAEVAADSVVFAKEHLSEREAAWSEAEFHRAAMSVAWGNATWGQIQVAAAREEVKGGVIRKIDGTLTTEAAQRLEARMLRIEERGRGAVPAIASDSAKLSAQLDQTKLNSGQRGAVEMVMTTTNRIVAIQGLAGVGKTTLLDEFRKQAEVAGYKLEGVAPSHSAVKALGEAGIAGKTLQTWEAAGGKLDEKTVLVVDESSLASTKQVAFVLSQAEKAGARIVLVGDSGQYQSVDAGKGFAQLQNSGMQTAVVDKMLRQQVDELRLVARLAAEGKGAEALAAHGDYVQVIAERSERHSAIAKQFAALDAAERNDTLILTGSNADRLSLNAAVRENLGLAGKGVPVQMFERGDQTAAEQRLVKNWQVGDAVRFEKHYRSLGAAKGEIWKVKAIEVDEVRLTSPDGTREVKFAPGRMSGKGMTVGAVRERELSAGDRIRITGDIRVDGQVLRNGQRVSVLEVSAERLSMRVDGQARALTIDTRRVLSLDHGYAATGHSAQGLGAKRIFLERDSQSRTASERQFYTDVTRAKQELVIVTDDRSRLAKAISRRVDKTQALDADTPSFDPGLPDPKEVVIDKVQDLLQARLDRVVDQALDASRVSYRFHDLGL